MTKDKFEQPRNERTRDVFDRSRQLRSDALAEMGAGFWARLFGGARKGARPGTEMADC